MITVEREIVCPKCRRIKKVTFVTAMDSAKEKTLNSTVMNYEIFTYECFHCKRHFRMVYNFVYINSDKKFIICLLPDTQKDAVLFKKVNKMYPGIMKYTKRMVKTVEDLKEKILIFESDLNDVVIEEMKNQILTNIDKEERSKINKLYFCMLDNDLRRISFYSKLKNGEDYYYTVRSKEYDYAETIVKKRRKARKDKKLFFVVENKAGVK